MKNKVLRSTLLFMCSVSLLVQAFSSWAADIDEFVEFLNNSMASFDSRVQKSAFGAIYKEIWKKSLRIELFKARAAGVDLSPETMEFLL